jgi:hypothetical protein
VAHFDAALRRSMPDGIGSTAQPIAGDLADGRYRVTIAIPQSTDIAGRERLRPTA